MPRRPHPASFDDGIAAEHAAVTAGAPGCGHTCRCHGGYTCVRTVHDNYGNHWAGPDSPAVIVGQTLDQPVFGYVFKPENRVSHAGYLDDGQLVTWSGPHLTDDEIDAAADLSSKAAALVALTLLTSLDPDVLRAHLGL